MEEVKSRNKKDNEPKHNPDEKEYPPLKVDQGRESVTYVGLQVVQVALTQTDHQ